HKRAVQRPPTLATDIYVSRKSNFHAQSKRAQKLIDGQNFTFLTIHGLGAAINRAIELALHVKEQNKDRIAWSITTSTVTLADDVEPENVVRLSDFALFVWKDMDANHLCTVIDIGFYIRMMNWRLPLDRIQQCISKLLESARRRPTQNETLMRPLQFPPSPFLQRFVP
ncbi:hypothetical protein DFJ77DRAFT_425289, partial [Powellomyces hirtus]